jgi:23S rRNA (guanosine2251-2'-O)-methyltransferase
VLQGGRAPWEFDPGDKVALVLGSEGGGLRRGVAGKLDFAVRIPMGAASESLNVSVAGALLLYEWLARPPAG